MLTHLDKKLGSCSPTTLNTIITSLPAVANSPRIRGVVDKAVAR
jgi:hypothetical protein